MYKDEAKRKEANKEAAQRRRDRLKGMTKGMTQSAENVIPSGKNVIPSDKGVTELPKGVTDNIISPATSCQLSKLIDPITRKKFINLYHAFDAHPRLRTEIFIGGNTLDTMGKYAEVVERG